MSVIKGIVEKEYEGEDFETYKEDVSILTFQIEELILDTQNIPEISESDK